MARHPVTLLAPAALCALVTGVCTALTVRAFPRGADTFFLVGCIGAVFFALRAVIEARRAWPKFRTDLAHLTALRRSAPFTRINLRKDDIR